MNKYTETEVLYKIFHHINPTSSQIREVVKNLVILYNRFIDTDDTPKSDITYLYNKISHIFNDKTLSKNQIVNLINCNYDYIFLSMTTTSSKEEIDDETLKFYNSDEITTHQKEAMNHHAIISVNSTPFLATNINEFINEAWDDFIISFHNYNSSLPVDKHLRLFHYHREKLFIQSVNSFSVTNLHTDEVITFTENIEDGDQRVQEVLNMLITNLYWIGIEVLTSQYIEQYIKPILSDKSSYLDELTSYIYPDSGTLFDEVKAATKMKDKRQKVDKYLKHLQKEEAVKTKVKTHIYPIKRLLKAAVAEEAAIKINKINANLFL